MARTGAAADDVAAALRADIVAGRLLGGVTIREAELAAQLGVSRTPVREAIARLTTEGLLVRNGSGRGTTVFRPSLSELTETYEIRLALEPLAAGLAARHIKDDDAPKLVAMFEELGNASSDGWNLQHAEFHHRIYEYAQRPQLIELVRTLRHRSEPYIRLYIGIGNKSVAQQGHRDILDAITRHDEDAAAEATHAHLSTTLSHLQEYVKHRSNPDLDG